MFAAIIFLGLVLVGSFLLEARTPKQVEDIAAPRFRGDAARIGSAEVVIEIADTQAKWIKGLSGRMALEQDQGMMFLFPELSQKSFWNKDTFIPLDVIWIREGSVKGISLLPAEEKGKNPTVVTSPGLIDDVLEVNAGWAETHGIKIGDRISF